MKFWMVLPIVFFTACAAADVVRLKDGTSVTGDVKKTEGGWTVVGADGTTRHIASVDVKSIELTSTTQPNSDNASQGLGSLRRAVENLSDPKQVIERYQLFIKGTAGTPAEKEARQIGRAH